MLSTDRASASRSPPCYALRSAAAQDFAGKTIDLLVGAPPGGGYDI